MANVECQPQIITSAFIAPEKILVDCQVVIRHGHPRDVVKELVTSLQAGRVVLGTHGRPSLKEVFLGSTADEILKSVEVPVWTVGPHGRPFSHGQPQRILHPVSLSSGYEETAQLAMKLGEFYRAEVTLLHVLPRDLHAEYADEKLELSRALELGRPRRSASRISQSCTGRSSL